MAFAELYGFTATVSTTEYSMTANSTSLGAVTTDGVYQAVIDFSAMAAGDSYEIKFYEKALSGGTQRLMYTSTVVGAQAFLWVSPAIVLLHGWEMSLKRLAGSDRSLSWSVRQVA